MTYLDRWVDRTPKCKEVGQLWRGYDSLHGSLEVESKERRGVEDVGFLYSDSSGGIAVLYLGSLE